jgi:hypothetical protein
VKRRVHYSPDGAFFERFLWALRSCDLNLLLDAPLLPEVLQLNLESGAGNRSSACVHDTLRTYFRTCMSLSLITSNSVAATYTPERYLRRNHLLHTSVVL